MNIRSIVFTVATMLFPVAVQACPHVGMLLGAGVCPQCGAAAAGVGYAPPVALGASYSYGAAMATLPVATPLPAAVLAPLPAAVVAPSYGAVGLGYGATLGAGIGSASYGYSATVGAPVGLGYSGVGLGGFGYGAHVGLGLPARHFGAVGVGYGGAVGVPFGAGYGGGFVAPAPVVVVNRPGLINRFRGAIRGFRRGF